LSYSMGKKNPKGILDLSCRSPDNSRFIDMGDGIRISAVIPTYNRERTIARAIDSALAQRFPASEIIIMDDGSADNTGRIAESYGGKIRYLYQANGGVSAARNRGVQEAKGEWIAFLDSDDYWLPDHLGRMAKAIEATEGKAALYFCDLQRPGVESACRHWEYCGFKIHGPFEFRHDASEWVLMGIQPMMTPASVIRRANYLEVGGLPGDLRSREDTLLFFKLGLLYPACAVSDVGAVVTSDADMRLTREICSSSPGYSLATISLYKEVLALGNRINRKTREILIEELSAAHFGLARVFYREKKYLSSVRKLFDSAFLSPAAFGKVFLGSLWGKVRE
jgi:glycosyltransferase involved in cell wall biosynthesis